MTKNNGSIRRQGQPNQEGATHSRIMGKVHVSRMSAGPRDSLAGDWQTLGSPSPRGRRPCVEIGYR
jgi:hypothetical protein